MKSINNSLALISTLAAAVLATPSFADDDGPWLIRGGVVNVDPKSDNGRVSVGDVTIDNRLGPSVELTYFFAPQWAVNVLGALPFEHSISINGGRAGTAKHLPPTVTLQHHFMTQGRIRPYAGVGLNYTMFGDEQLDGGGELKLEDSVGISLQAGVDVMVGDSGWLVGADVRYMDIDTDASVNGADIGTVEIDPLVYGVTIGRRL
ncbi:MAG TPA: OmpW family outer membrane protein [Solimonas sp.]|nr:OmpW family outer membrane protein [Solimonas sp.]